MNKQGETRLENASEAVMEAFDGAGLSDSLTTEQALF